MAINPNRSSLDFNHIFQRCFDEPNDRLRVDATISATIGTTEVIIDHTNDSIRLGDGVNFYTSTTVGADVGLDVNLIGGVVSGTFTPTGLKTGLKSQSITVTDVPTKIPTTAFTSRNGISVRVWGTPIVYFGSSSVTVAAGANAGYPKIYREEIIMDVQDAAAVDLYGICEAGQTCEVRVLEIA